MRQDIIYKAVPWLQEYEEALRSAFYATTRIDRHYDEGTLAFAFFSK